MGIRHEPQESSETQFELSLDHRPVRNIVAIFVTGEIGNRIELPQLFLRDREIGGRELAFFAHQQSGNT